MPALRFFRPATPAETILASWLNNGVHSLRYALDNGDYVRAFHFRRILVPHWSKAIFDARDVGLRDSIDQALTSFELLELGYQSSYLDPLHTIQRCRELLVEFIWAEPVRQFIRDYGLALIESLANRCGLPLGEGRAQRPSLSPANEIRFADFLSSFIDCYTDSAVRSWQYSLDDYRLRDEEGNEFRTYLAQGSSPIDSSHRVVFTERCFGMLRFVTIYSDFFATVKEEDWALYGQPISYWLHRMLGFGYAQDGSMVYDETQDWSRERVMAGPGMRDFAASELEEGPSGIEPFADTARRIESLRRVRAATLSVSDRSAGTDLSKATGTNPLPELDATPAQKASYSAETLEAMARLIELKLRDLDVEADVVAVRPGPVVTQFELQPTPGTKNNETGNLAKDLARALSVTSVRIIPGKSTIALEIPNENRELVTLGEIIKSKTYDEMASPLAVVLGKDVGGTPVVADLSRMPHLLVGGTTDSGKSMAIKAMVLSLIYKATPEQVRIIMIDPKMLELSMYEGIPHLLTPVVTDMRQAANALRWCVAEMERRYQLMAALGVHNVRGLNLKIKEAQRTGAAIRDPLFVRTAHPQGSSEEAPPLEQLPFIVVIVDELADLMMIVGKKVEEFIARLAQKARASGIHMILATQRPSLDVITGLIKANIPARIAFQVSKEADSRVILDQMGAEQLLGHEDMLYMSPGSAVPIRVHGASVTDVEVHRVVGAIKGRTPVYRYGILEGSSTPISGALVELLGHQTAEDPLYDEAVRIVVQSRKASISRVRRLLKIGYNRAARMIEIMEATGLVGPAQDDGVREVFAPAPPDD